VVVSGVFAAFLELSPACQPGDQHEFITPCHYAFPIGRRALALPLFIAATLVAGTGCAGSDSDDTPALGTSRGITTSSDTATETGGIDPLEGASTEPVSAPATREETALLERVALARHEGYDRVVFQFRNVVPGFRVEYVDPPLKEDGSGNTVKVEGDAFVLVRMEQASGFDLTVAEGELVYKGPRRLEGSDAGTSVVREVVRSGDFEAVLSWVVGLSDRVDFRVTTLDEPPRLVVDFRNH